MNGDVVGLWWLVKQAMVRIRNSDLPAEDKAAALAVVERYYRAAVAAARAASAQFDFGPVFF